ncbi:MAG: outer membrane beta-barrel protein [Saprospiraceae bacterium]|nr:outer membrane beta-barrel protein [Saprospiraceae bacterium]
MNIGITANLGLSKVTSNFLVSDDYKVKYTYSGNIGVFIEKEIGNKSSLGAEVLWVQIGGKETTDNKILTAFDGQDLKVVGIISDVAKLNSSYIAFPFYYRVQLNKIGIKIGLQTMFFLLPIPVMRQQENLMASHTMVKAIQVESSLISSTLDLKLELNII